MLRFLTAGESHGESLIAILEGLPAPTQEQRERCANPNFSILKQRKKPKQAQ